MRAVRASRFGGPEVLVATEAPDPVAGPGQVVVQVAATSVVFVETQLRRGFSPGPPLPEPPYVPGGGAAGDVIAVGQDVDADWVGRNVAGHTRTGSYAERALVSTEELVPVPEDVSLPEAAALLSDGRTALGLFDDVHLQPGDRVLVEAAAGGVGILLVQLARAAGARVIGAAGGRRKLDVLRQWGLDAVVDYSQPGWTARVLEATGNTGPDVVFDGVGGDIGRAAFDVTARGGRFSVHGAASGSATEITPDEAQRRGVTMLGLGQLLAHADPVAQSARALREAAAGRLRPLIGQTFPLEKAADAHTAIENREAVGKTLLLADPRDP